MTVSITIAYKPRDFSATPQRGAGGIARVKKHGVKTSSSSCSSSSYRSAQGNSPLPSMVAFDCPFRFAKGPPRSHDRRNAARSVSFRGSFTRVAQSDGIGGGGCASSFLIAASAFVLSLTYFACSGFRGITVKVVSPMSNSVGITKPLGNSVQFEL